MVKTRRYKRVSARSYKKRRTIKRRLRRSLRRKTKVGGWGGLKLPEFGGNKERESLYGGWGEPLVSP